MPLMDRIKVRSFLSYSSSEKQNFIMLLQMKRKNSIKEAATKKVRAKTVKITTKAKTKSTRRSVTAQQKAEKALLKLSPAALDAMIAKLSL